MVGEHAGVKARVEEMWQEGRGKENKVNSRHGEAGGGEAGITWSQRVFVSPCVGEGKFHEELPKSGDARGRSSECNRDSLSRLGSITMLKSPAHMAGTEGCWAMKAIPPLQQGKLKWGRYVEG